MKPNIDSPKKINNIAGQAAAINIIPELKATSRCNLSNSPVTLSLEKCG